MASDAQALIIYGDGLQALYYDEKNPRLNHAGVKVQPLLVVPSEELKAKVGIKDEDLKIVTNDNRKGMWIDYPIMKIKWLNRSKTGALIIIFCSFDGSDTLLMDYYDELLQYIETMEKKEARLRSQIATLEEEVRNMTTYLAEWFREKKDIIDIVNEPKDSDEED
jgi:hypothetical protein